MAHLSISLSHILIFFMISGVISWTIVLIAGIHVALGWIEPLFTQAPRPRRAAPTIHRYQG